MSLAASSSSGVNPAVGALLFVLYTAAYFVPTIVAIARRGAANTGSVIVVNFLLGWTVIGWIVALAMACRSHRPTVIMQMPPPGWVPPQSQPGLPPPTGQFPSGPGSAP